MSPTVKIDRYWSDYAARYRFRLRKWRAFPKFPRWICPGWWTTVAEVYCPHEARAWSYHYRVPLPLE